MANYSSFGYMPLDVAEQYAKNKKDWAVGDDSQKNISSANNQLIRDAYGIKQDVPLGEVERYIEALKADNSKKALITKLTNPAISDEVRTSAEAIKNFKYDPNTDPLYQSYVDAYNRQGQSAAKQTMANLAASNMGRGSSYGSAATAQVQQAYAKQATDMIPQLAQQAYERLMNNYSINKDLADTEYNRALTGYNTLADDATRELTNEGLRYDNEGKAIQSPYLNEIYKTELDTKKANLEGLNYSNQASQIELQYLEPSLRQQYEMGNISLEDAKLQSELNKDYARREREAALTNMYRGGSSGGSSSLSSTEKNLLKHQVDVRISEWLYSPKGYGGDGTFFYKDWNEDTIPQYAAVSKMQDADVVRNIKHDLINAGYTNKEADEKIEEYKNNIARQVLAIEGEDYDDPDTIVTKRSDLGL